MSHHYVCVFLKTSDIQVHAEYRIFYDDGNDLNTGMSIYNNGSSEED